MKAGVVANGGSAACGCESDRSIEGGGCGGVGSVGGSNDCRGGISADISGILVVVDGVLTVTLSGASA